MAILRYTQISNPPTYYNPEFRTIVDYCFLRGEKLIPLQISNIVKNVRKTENFYRG